VNQFGDIFIPDKAKGCDQGDENVFAGTGNPKFSTLI
jgi:hypothetical protein